MARPIVRTETAPAPARETALALLGTVPNVRRVLGLTDVPEPALRRLLDGDAVRPEELAAFETAWAAFVRLLRALPPADLMVGRGLTLEALEAAAVRRRGENVP